MTNKSIKNTLKKGWKVENRNGKTIYHYRGGKLGYYKPKSRQNAVKGDPQ